MDAGENGVDNIRKSQKNNWVQSQTKKAILLGFKMIIRKDTTGPERF